MSVVSSSVSRGVRAIQETGALGTAIDLATRHPNVTAMVLGPIGIGVAGAAINFALPGQPLSFGTAPSATILGGGLVLGGFAAMGRGGAAESKSWMSAGKTMAAVGASYAIVSNWNLPYVDKSN